MSTRCRNIVLFIFACVALASFQMVVAQTSFGTIVGAVVDETGGIIPGVGVLVTNQGTNERRSVVADATGRYSVPFLRPGVYSITAELPGFKKKVLSDITVQVNETISVDLKMEVGEISELVVVEGQASLLNKVSSTVGTVVDNKKIINLPLNGREFTQLILLIPGTSPLQAPPQRFTIGGIHPSVNGQRARNNNFTLDGVDNNEAIFNTFTISPSVDAIQEFKIQTNIVDAEFGKSAGANVNIAIKSGSNDFHGSIFEFLRNDKLDARDFFAAKRPPFKQNQFGFTLGGPIIHDKTFFFGNYEGFRRRRGQSIISTVPTPAQLQGDFSGGPPIFDPLTTRPGSSGTGFVRDRFPGNKIPATRINQIAKVYAKYYLVPPNLPGTAANLFNGKSQEVNHDQFNIRVDHQLSEKDSLFARFSWASRQQLTPTALPTVDSLLDNEARNAAISITHVFSPTTLLNYKFGFNRAFLFPNTNIPGPGGLAITREAGLKGYDLDSPDDLPPSISVAGVFTTPATGLVFLSNAFQNLLNLTKYFEKHSFKTGFDIQVFRILIDDLRAGNGSISFTPQVTSDLKDPRTGQSLASFLLGYPTGGARRVGSDRGYLEAAFYHFYVQDDIKLHARSTLNLGLRYEYNQNSREKFDRFSMWDIESQKFLWAKKNPITGDPRNARRSLQDPDWNNFAPRIGFAFLATPKTSIRAGYGIFYNAFNFQEQQIGRGQYPFAFQEFKGGLNTTFATTLAQDVFEVATQPIPTFSIAFNKRMRTGYVQQWNLSMQQELMKDLLAEVAYLGSHGSKLTTHWGWNLAPPGPGDPNLRRPFKGVGPFILIETRAPSKYHALQLKLEKRFSKGLSFLGSYAFAKSMDIVSELLGGTPQDINNIRADWGPSDFDLRNNFVLSFVYELPFGRGKRILPNVQGVLGKLIEGWQINGIATSRSGLPFTVRILSDNANTGGGGQRPDLVGNPALPKEQRSTQQWFNTKAFAVAPRFKFGNLGRNTLNSDGLQNIDFAIYKNTPIKENHLLQFRAEIFNIFNHANFAGPGNLVGSPTFGRVLSAGEPRDIQFALKYLF